MLKIVQLGDPILETKAKDVVDVGSKEVRTLITDMINVLNADSEKSAGISAPQVGKALNIAICRRVDLRKDNDKKPIWEVMINPKLIFVSKEKSTFWEGCLSIQKGNLFGRVTRPETVKVEYLDMDGKKKALEASDYFSHVVQHEIDHLNGVLFIKYIDNPQELYTAKELDRILED